VEVIEPPLFVTEGVWVNYHSLAIAQYTAEADPGFRKGFVTGFVDRTFKSPGVERSTAMLRSSTRSCCDLLQVILRKIAKYLATYRAVLYSDGKREG